MRRLDVLLEMEAAITPFPLMTHKTHKITKDLLQWIAAVLFFFFNKKKKK